MRPGSGTLKVGGGHDGQQQGREAWLRVPESSQRVSSVAAAGQEQVGGRAHRERGTVGGGTVADVQESCTYAQVAARVGRLSVKGKEADR